MTRRLHHRLSVRYSQHVDAAFAGLRTLDTLGFMVGGVHVFRENLVLDFPCRG